LEYRNRTEVRFSVHYGRLERPEPKFHWGREICKSGCKNRRRGRLEKGEGSTQYIVRSPGGE
jgi:hypothetical protein